MIATIAVSARKSAEHKETVAKLNAVRLALNSW
jgi:hypothetical protein